VAHVVERLERHARREPTIANDRHHVVPLACQVAGDGHAERRRDRGARVAGAEVVVRALVAGEETREPVLLAQRVELPRAAREQLVRIGLVAHVPHQLVGGAVEDAVQRYSQLDGPEVRGQVAAGTRHRV